MNKLVKYSSFVVLLLVTKTVTATEPIQLFHDNQFERGFIVLKPVHNKKIKGGTISLDASQEKLVWELAQWGSRFDLSNVKAESVSDSSIRFHDGAKTVYFEDLHQKYPSITFEVNARKEYQGHLRKSGEHWPHLLAEQQLNLQPKVTQLDELWFQIEYRLLKSEAFNRKVGPKICIRPSFWHT